MIAVLGLALTFIGVVLVRIFGSGSAHWHNKCDKVGLSMFTVGWAMLLVSAITVAVSWGHLP